LIDTLFSRSSMDRLFYDTTRDRIRKT